MININNITKHKSITGKGFRLVYSQDMLIALIEGTHKSTTHTKQEVEEFKAKENAEHRIGVLMLKHKEIK